MNELGIDAGTRFSLKKIKLKDGEFSEVPEGAEAVCRALRDQVFDIFYSEDTFSNTPKINKSFVYKVVKPSIVNVNTSKVLDIKENEVGNFVIETQTSFYELKIIA